MSRFPLRTFALTSICCLATAGVARADDHPFWSLSIGTPGLVANIGNVVPVAPPVYIAPPPVQYVPAPGYVYVVPGYGPRQPQYWRRHHEGEDHHWEDDDER